MGCQEIIARASVKSPHFRSKQIPLFAENFYPPQPSYVRRLTHSLISASGDQDYLASTRLLIKRNIYSIEVRSICKQSLSVLQLIAT